MIVQASDGRLFKARDLVEICPDEFRERLEFFELTGEARPFDWTPHGRHHMRGAPEHHPV